jgi:WD domain, G-beta repeat
LRREGQRAAMHRLSYGQKDPSPHDQLLFHLGVRAANRAVPFPLPNDAASRLWVQIHRKLPWSGVTHLILDQFEEVFIAETQRPETVEEVREALGILIQGTVPSPIARCLAAEETFFDYFDPDSQPVRIILALRDDYVYALNRWRRHLPQLGQNYFELHALRGPAAFDAVFEPGCLRAHKREENGALVDADTGLPPIISEATARRIVRFVAEKKEDVPLEVIEAVPPILSLLCRELNQGRYLQPPGVFGPPLAQIVFDEQTTNVETILETFYERCLAGRPEAVRIFIEEDLVSRSGLRLQNDERSIVDAFANGVGPHAAGYGDRGAATDCLRALVNERLLSPVSGGETPRYELTHDLLCRVVYKSRTARQERIEKERLERRAEQETRAKEEAEAREKTERGLRQAQETLAAENAKYAKEQKEAASKLRRLAWMLALVAVAAGAAAIFGFWQKAEAERQATFAEQAASQANVFLALNSNAIGNDSQELAYLAKALKLNPRNFEAGALTAALLTQESWPVVTGAMKHDGAVYSAQFSADGQRVVTASGDTARVWDAVTGKALGEPMKHDGAVYSAQFSADGQRVVTASRDQTARVWDAVTGKALSEPMKHDDVVWSAQFSVDGQRVVTTSWDQTARVWDIPIITRKDSADDVNLLADLAEATGGLALKAFGQTEILAALTPDQVKATRDKIAVKFPGPPWQLTPLQRFLKWSVSDRTQRTISPFSKLTVPEWIENRIKESTLESLRAAIQMDPANARLIAHFGLALTNLAVAEKTNPDDARRARAEADYQTHRAVKLASENDEVKKLRTKVVKLLNVPSDPKTTN